ncbi:MAG: threonine/serine exporter family protein [Atopobiaceae bacterium]|nr:threonine/serine exporter family protein [Atopobiaceae bacterium]MCH4276087.1 threonine/serine exporter family protein [Atopobiaceae bacterium]MCI1259649.1 threonine/serine exporter family protein [Atopobiaceae bacterium]MDD2587406.1 threonine/serine exporter family protein [Atopobiaceae bacterium]MDD3486236.1 threonine/serine exporter family protein [Atopobiaceae bacterium]
MVTTAGNGTGQADITRATANMAAHHRRIAWHEAATAGDEPASSAPLADKADLVGRVGLMLLAAGTGAWRVREAMNRMSDVLGVTCVADVGLTSISASVRDGDELTNVVLSLPSSGVNTERIWLLERAVADLEASGADLTVHEWHDKLDRIERVPGRYAPWAAGLASAFACGAFVFLLGGGPIEMLCAFVGAGIGNWLRRLMLDRHINQFCAIGGSVACACLAYLAVLNLLPLVGVADAASHEVGYIGAMLFVIPGFPLITSGLDLMKLDLRSGIERLVYAVAVIFVATLVAWLVASFVALTPGDFEKMGLTPLAYCLLRLVASFVGVYGFSVMFNSPPRMAATAGLIGMVANTLRLELVSLAGTPPEAAAFAGALTAGLLASAVCRRVGFPRISLTVPSIVIMVPGLYMYKAIYYMGIFDAANMTAWLARAVIIVAFLPLGLGLARALTDTRWRHCS